LFANDIAYAIMKKHRGVVVPMVTPFSATGSLDEHAVHRTIESLLAAKVDGIFVLGTTGEAASVPGAIRRRFVDLAVTQAQGRALVYAGLNDNCLSDTVEAANEYFRTGVDAVVALSPFYFPLQPQELSAYFEELLCRMNGPVILYNIPTTTHSSIPIPVLEELVGHPRLAGIKDSENDEARLVELMRRLGGRTDFSIFIGVGALMARMLSLGADGIVPSVGNLVPELCQDLFASVRAGHAAKVEQLHKRMMETAMIYQRGHTLGQSLSALKTAMSLKGLCEPTMLMPLANILPEERERIRQEMLRLGLLAAAPDASLSAGNLSSNEL